MCVEVIVCYIIVVFFETQCICEKTVVVLIDKQSTGELSLCDDSLTLGA